MCRSTVLYECVKRQLYFLGECVVIIPMFVDQQNVYDGMHDVNNVLNCIDLKHITKKG